MIPIPFIVLQRKNNAVRFITDGISFANNMFQYIVNEKLYFISFLIVLLILVKLIPDDPKGKKSALVWVMACRPREYTPLPETMLTLVFGDDIFSAYVFKLYSRPTIPS